MRTNRRQLIGAAIIALSIIFGFTQFRVVVVRGVSMEPTYQNGQMVLVSRLSALMGRWKRGDVVLVRVADEVLIKRIAYLPGEILPVRAALPFIQVQEFFEPTDDRRNPLRVPPGYVVILGDNADESDDSRSFGPIPVKDIIGRVINAPPPR